MTTYTTDHLAFLRAIAEQPDEDTPRLIYADWLDDQDVCPDPGRAELIRVQCALSPYPNASDTPQPRHMTPASKWVALRARESALLAEHGERWRKGPVCDWCKGIARYLGSPCARCHGTGDAGGLMRRFMYPNRWKYDRGWPKRLVVPRLADLVEHQDWQGIPRVGDDGEIIPTPWLHSVLTATPERALIREVVPLDREPTQSITGWWWGSPRAVGTVTSCVLPEKLFKLLVDGPHFTLTQSYSTRERAVSALATQIAALGRRA